MNEDKKERILKDTYTEVMSKVRLFKQFIRKSPAHLVTYLVHGIIMVIPLGVTIWVIVWLFNLVDGILSPILEWVFGRPVPGLGFAIIITSTILIGYFGIKTGHRKAFSFFESYIIRIPIVGSVYGNIRQILESFTVSDGSKFLEVIFMEFPRTGIYTVGLVTSEAKNKDGKKVLNVFIPTAPNPTSGFLQIVPESDVVHTTMSISEAMKMIISAGKVSRDDIADMLMQVPHRKAQGRS